LILLVLLIDFASIITPKYSVIFVWTAQLTA